MKGGSNTVSDVHKGESVIDQRNTMESRCHMSDYILRY